MTALVHQAALAIASLVLAGLWQGALIAGAVWLVLRSLRDLGASTRYAIWLCALAALLVVPIATVALSSAQHPAATSLSTTAAGAEQPSTPRTAPRAATANTAPAAAGPAVSRAVQRNPAAQSAAAQNAAAQQTATRNVVARNAGALNGAVQTSAVAPASAVFGDASSRARIAIPESLAIGVALLWLLFAGARFVKLALALGELRTIRRDATAWSSSYEYPVLLSPTVRVPLALGFVRRAVVLPAGLVDEIGAGALETIIVHESAHLRRNDVWTNALARVIEALLAVNPAAWFVMRRLSAEREIACDDCVVARTGSGDAFANVLADLATRIGTRAAIAAPSATGSPRSAIVTRIERLLDASPRRLRLSPPALAAAVASLAVVALVVESVSPVLAYAPSQPVPAQPAYAAAPQPVYAAPPQPGSTGGAGVAAARGRCPTPGRGLCTPELVDGRAAVAKFGASRVITFDLSLDATGTPRGVVIRSTPYPAMAARVQHILMINHFRPVLREGVPVAATVHSAVVLGTPHAGTFSIVDPVYPNGWSAQHGSSCKVPPVEHSDSPAFPASVRGLPVGAEYAGSVRVRVDASGAVTSASLVRSAGRRAFDDALLAAARGATYPLADQTRFRPVRPSRASLAWNASHGASAYAKCTPLPSEYVWHTTFGNTDGFLLATRRLMTGAGHFTWR